MQVASYAHYQVIVYFLHVCLQLRLISEESKISGMSLAWEKLEQESYGEDLYVPTV
jgi:hypothetical protein